MKSLLDKLDALDRDVRRRDVREYIAACVVIAIFGWMAATADEPFARIGALIVVFGAMFIIVWSRASAASGRAAFNSDLPIAQFCARELEKVDAQVKLLKSAWWWYVMPTVVGVLVMLLPKSVSLGAKVLTALFVLAVGVAVHWANVTAARHQLEPLRDELAARLREL